MTATIAINDGGEGMAIDVTGIPERALFDLVRSLTLDPDTAETLKGQFDDPGDWIAAYARKVSPAHMAEIWQQLAPEIRLACRSPYRPLPNLMLRYEVGLGVAADWDILEDPVTVLRSQAGERITQHPQHRLYSVGELGGDCVTAGGYLVDERKRAVGLHSRLESDGHSPRDWQVFDADPVAHPVPTDDKPGFGPAV